jgi:ATP-dependent Clp protease ATP-binding subunit ClpC
MAETGAERSPALARAIERATEEARRLGHRRVGSEHLLLALLVAPEGPVRDVLAALRLGEEAVRSEILQVMPGSSRPVAGDLPFTESAAGALRRAEAVARRLRAALVDTDHLLLGIALQVEGAGSRVLLDFGATVEKIRTLVEQEAAEHASNACARCGTPLERAWRYCPMCGTARVSHGP